jgi:hypothetical protein
MSGKKLFNPLRKRSTFPLLLLVPVLVALVVLPVQRAMADDDQTETTIWVEAPIDSVSCTATPPTVSVLGLNIDVSNAGMDGVHAPTCASLTPGREVKVTLASETPDATTNLLTATALQEVGWSGREGQITCDWSGPKLNAPIQAVDPSGTSVTFLGLAVDISHAELQADDDEQPIIVNQLTVGQFTKVTLASDQAPLSATRLRVHMDEFIRVKAPIDAVNCSATPPTISMLGLTIDVSKAIFEMGDGDDDNQATCANLTPGQIAKVTLVSDTPATSGGPLTAVSVQSLGAEGSFQCSWNGPKITAPLQNINVTGNSITVLGLTVDISSATIQDSDGDAVTASQLMTGQFAWIDLNSNQAPLAANAMVVQPLEVKVQAPLDAVNCSTTPPTIGMLGLSIDITQAVSGGGGGGLTCDHTPSCSDLTAGQTVRVKLSGATPDPTTKLLTATSLHEVWGCGFNNNPLVRVIAPIQTLGTNSVTVLGLPVNISNATIITDNDQLIPASQLITGEFVELLLTSNKAPLSATLLEAQSYYSQISVQVVDQKGNAINDGTLKDMQAVVSVKTKKKTVVFNTMSNGAFSLNGLPPGQAKISVTRSHNGHTNKASGSATVQSSGTQQVRMVMKGVVK